MYCGHEYSIQNLSFGASVEPENETIAKKLEWSRIMRAKNPPEPTVPSTIGKSRGGDLFLTRATLETKFAHAGQYTYHMDLSDLTLKRKLAFNSPFSMFLIGHKNGGWPH